MIDGHHLAGVFAIATTTIAVATPLLLAALGEVVVERAGIINVGIEGMILSGAYAAYAGSHATGSPIIGAVAAVAAGVALSALFALMVLKYRADQVVVGTAINILAFGITGVLTPIVSEFDNVPSLRSHVLVHAGSANVSADGLAWTALLLTVAVSLFLMRTLPGLRLRAIGEYPAAAADAGCDIDRYRLAAITFGGALAGLAGVCLSIGYNVGIGQGISSGRGFIALAVVIVGRWSPLGALPAAILFGVATALQAWYQAVGLAIPYQVLLALPYVLTLITLAMRSGKTSAPAALGETYKPE